MSDFQSPFRVFDTMVLPQNTQNGFWKNDSCSTSRTLRLLKWFRSLPAGSVLEAKYAKLQVDDGHCIADLET